MESFSLAPWLTMSLLTLATPTTSPTQYAKIGVYELPVVSGLWQVQKQNACQEFYNFGADGHLKTVSGEEITYGQYSLLSQEQGLPILSIKTVYDNNAVDCSGTQIDQSGEVFSTFLWLDDKHDPKVMRWCSDNQAKTCLNFNKILP